MGQIETLLFFIFECYPTMIENDKIRTERRLKMSELFSKTDGLGGIFGAKHSEAIDAPRVLVAAHMDEVGFMVSEIKPDGTFRVVQIGGWNPLVVSSQRFKLFTSSGVEIPVISGSVPPHLTRGTGGPSLPRIEDIVLRLYQIALLFSQLMGKTLSQKLGTIVTVSSW